MTFRKLLLALALLLVPASTALAVPLSLAHQGYLADADGEAVTGSIVITFSLWDEAGSGSQVWSEARTVDVVDGSYSTLLGSETPIADVLRAEPALWLQLEIAGEALLPRHPVASAPYAVVADTAVNVEGGTVNASSVSVGGSEVIDGTGAWTGGAGSIDWSAVTGAPDTVGGLSCADGDRAVWNDGLSLWECGSATVTLDRIETSGGSLGEVLAVGSGGAEWQSAAAGAGCTPTVLSPTLTSLDCGGQALRVSTTPEFVALPRGGSDLMAVDSSGDLYSSTGASFDYGFPPAGPYASVEVESGSGCGVRTDGTLGCWGALASGAPTGNFTVVRIGSAGACAISLAGDALSCWPSSAEYQWLASAPSGAFTNVLVGSIWACGVHTNGSIECWGNTPTNCWAVNQPSGTYDDILRVADSPCATSGSGPTTCFAPCSNSTAPSWTPPPNIPSGAVNRSSYWVYWLTGAGTVTGVDFNSGDTAEVRPGSYSVLGGGGYAIDLDGDVVRIAGTLTRPPWTLVTP